MTYQEFKQQPTSWSRAVAAAQEALKPGAKVLTVLDAIAATREALGPCRPAALVGVLRDAQSYRAPFAPYYVTGATAPPATDPPLSRKEQASFARDAQAIVALRESVKFQHLMAAVLSKDVARVRDLAYDIDFRYVDVAHIFRVMDAVAGTSCDDVFLFIQTALYVMYPVEEFYDHLVKHARLLVKTKPLLGNMRGVLAKVVHITNDAELRDLVNSTY
jgi:hypothetical protein